MDINRTNYEAFFIDYVHNELPPAERLQVEAFAARHPELQEELQQLKDSILAPDPDIRMVQKGSLYPKTMRTVPEQEEVESLVIRDLDGELNTEEKAFLIDLLKKNDAYRQLQEYYAHARFTADPALRLSNKELLLKPVSGRKVMMYRALRFAGAAMLLLLSGLYLWPPQPKIAVKTPLPSTAKKTPDPGKRPLLTETISPVAPMNIQVKAIARTKKPEGKYHGGSGKNLPQLPIGWPLALTTEITEKEIKDPHLTNTTDPIPLTSTPPVEFSPLEATVAATHSSADVSEWSSRMESDLPFPVIENSTGKNHKIREVFRKITRTMERTLYQKNDDPAQQIRIASFQIALK